MFGNKHKKILEGMSLLQTAENDTGAVVIAGLLQSCGIETYLDYDGEINIRVVAGNSNLPVNIYVREADLETAKAILAAPEAEQDE